MATPGNTYSTLVREVWTPQLETTVFFNNWMFDGSMFPVVDAPGGTTISTGYEYLISSNAGTFNHDDPMVEPFTSSQIRAYFNKDFFQESARTFDQYVDMMANGGTEPANFAPIQKSLETATKNLLDKTTTTMIADLEAQIDSASTYSDALLSRTTYATLKSYEETSSTGLTIAHLEDMVEAIMTHTTYGQQVRSEQDLLFLFPRNQLTNLSRLSGGQAYNADLWHMTTSTQNMGPADAGRVFRTKQFEGIPIQVVPDMTNTVILCVHRPDITIYRNRALRITPKSELADTQLAMLSCGYNAICKCPGNSGKLSAKTA